MASNNLSFAQADRTTDEVAEIASLPAREGLEGPHDGGWTSAMEPLAPQMPKKDTGQHRIPCGRLTRDCPVTPSKRQSSKHQPRHRQRGATVNLRREEGRYGLKNWVYVDEKNPRVSDDGWDLLEGREIVDLVAEVNRRAVAELSGRARVWRDRCVLDAERCRQYFLANHARLSGRQRDDIMRRAKGQHEVGGRAFEAGGPRATMLLRLRQAEVDTAWLGISLGMSGADIEEMLSEYYSSTRRTVAHDLADVGRQHMDMMQQQRGEAAQVSQQNSDRLDTEPASTGTTGAIGTSSGASGSSTVATGSII